MTKYYLKAIIEKYYLDGLVERVKLHINENNILIKFINENKNLTGIIEASDFDFQNSEIGIYDTTQFLKLISILDELIELKPEEKNGIIQKLLIADNIYNLEYPLANINIIPKAPSEIEDVIFNIDFDINKEFINNFLKASKVLKVDTLIIETYFDEGVSKIKFIIGEDSNFSNKIDFSINGKIEIPGSVIFPLNEFSSILNNNKDLRNGKGYINEEGLFKLEFESEDSIKSTYYLVGKE